MALIIVIAVAPVQGWLRRHGWPAWATTLVVILLVYAILLVLALGIIFSIARLATELPQYAAKADGLVTSATAELAKLGVGPDQIKQAAGSLNLGKLAGVLGALLGSVAGLATNLVFLLALLLFLSVESGGVRRAARLDRRGPAADHRGARPLRLGHPAVPAGHHRLRADRRGARLGRARAPGHPAGDHLGPAVVHHQLHPERRVHHRRDPAGAARRC